MPDTIFTAAVDQQTPAHRHPALPPLCSPAIIVERTLAHGLLALSSLVLVVVQALAHGVFATAASGGPDVAPQAAAPAEPTVVAAAPVGCRAPLVTREAFSAWADGLIARRIGSSR